MMHPGLKRSSLRERQRKRAAGDFARAAAREWRRWPHAAAARASRGLVFAGGHRAFE
jgi:hypothetical protein